MYVGNNGEKKLWIQHLKQAIRENLKAENGVDELDLGNANPMSTYSSYNFRPHDLRLIVLVNEVKTFLLKNLMSGMFVSLPPFIQVWFFDCFLNDY